MFNFAVRSGKIWRTLRKNLSNGAIPNLQSPFRTISVFPQDSHMYYRVTEYGSRVLPIVLQSLTIVPLARVGITVAVDSPVERIPVHRGNPGSILESAVESMPGLSSERILLQRRFWCDLSDQLLIGLYR